MRILHLVDEPYDSGIVQYALSAAEGLARRGHPALLWGRTGAYPLREAARRGIPARGTPRPWLGLAALRRLLLEEGFDLAVAHTGSAHTLALAAGLGAAVPVIRTRGDARPMRRRPGGRFLWRQTAGFIAANGAILAEHRRLHPRAGLPCAVIHEGYGDPGPPRPPMNGPLTIGIVGRLDPVKGHKDFLRAASLVCRKVPGARFLVVGRQENVKSADLIRLARELGLADSLQLTGHVPAVFDWMSRCHVGVVASTGSEAVSRVAVEWMSAGRPLVATSVGCLPEYVAEGRTGFLAPPGEPEALAERILRLASDVFLREALGRAARGRYEELFTLERFLDRSERFYEQTLYAVSSR